MTANYINILIHRTQRGCHTLKSSVTNPADLKRKNEVLACLREGQLFNYLMLLLAQEIFIDISSLVQALTTGSVIEYPPILSLYYPTQQASRCGTLVTDLKSVK